METKELEHQPFKYDMEKHPKQESTARVIKKQDYIQIAWTLLMHYIFQVSSKILCSSQAGPQLCGREKEKQKIPKNIQNFEPLRMARRKPFLTSVTIFY